MRLRRAKRKRWERWVRDGSTALFTPQCPSWHQITFIKARNQQNALTTLGLLLLLTPLRPGSADVTGSPSRGQTLRPSADGQSSSRDWTRSQSLLTIASLHQETERNKIGFSRWESRDNTLCFCVIEGFNLKQHQRRPINYLKMTNKNVIPLNKLLWINGYLELYVISWFWTMHISVQLQFPINLWEY